LLLDFERVERIRHSLLQKYPDSRTELRFESHFQLLVSVVLSAQCTDKRVNLITPKLFENFPTPQKMAEAQYDEVRELIKSCNLFQNKAKYLISLSQQLLENFGGDVPLEAKKLQSLSGVGQKTANVVLIEAKGENLMAVDTHVFRVAHRLGLSSAKTPTATERDLTEIFRTDLGSLHQAMVLFGRYHCTAKNPKCSDCFISSDCPTLKGDLE
jgi:endonuclease-3